MKYKAVNPQLGCQIFKALSEFSRVRILNLIQHADEMCISDLEQILDYTQTKTSRHLSYLKNVGLLDFRKQDQWVYYFIKEEFSTIVSMALSMLETSVMLDDDYNRFKTLYGNNELAIRGLHNSKNKYILPEL